MRQNNGFTLIELIIVVSIIGIIASIMVPKLQQYFKMDRAVEYQQVNTIEYKGEISTPVYKGAH